jgi:hypothetical protein
MRKAYAHSQSVTKELLDAIEVGNLVRINNWERPMRVVGVSNNYLLMVRKSFGRGYYAVCEKLPWAGIRHNAMRGGMFHLGSDNWIGGSSGFPNDLNSIDEINAYLGEFERGHTELSARSAIPVYDLYVKAS